MLIGSLRRNLAAHEDWEKDEGFDWPAWQALKLANLEKFRRQNQELMQRYKPVIDRETRTMLQNQFREGHASLKNDVTDNSFFGVNTHRNEALIADMLGTEEKVESAALRMMDDVYRHTVHKAQLAMSAGAVTLPKAIDMATRDFLDKGINCIVYKNGTRHNIADYVQMALQTTAVRSYLQGEAQKRQEFGVDTVLVSQYGACSETCLPWQGRVYIDDVFVPFTGERRGEEGKSREGNWYPLLSTAVKGGLFHPNCRHTLSTWYEGISTKPKPMDKEKIRKNARLEAKQREMEREVRKWKRLAEGTQDPEKRKEYRQKVRESQKKLREFIAAHSDVLRRDYWRESTHNVPVDNSRKSGIIKSGRDKMYTDIEIDRFTPCLTERETGRIVQTSFSTATPEELANLKDEGWLFDWLGDDLQKATVYKLTAKESSKIQGLIALTDFSHDQALYVNIAESAPWNRGVEKKYEGVGGHLFAIAAQISIDHGFGGFVFMDAKNVDLVRHYQDKMGAQLLGMPHPYRMFIDEEAASRLLEIYTLGGE